MAATHIGWATNALAAQGPNLIRYALPDGIDGGAATPATTAAAAAMAAAAESSGSRKRGRGAISESDTAPAAAAVNENDNDGGIAAAAAAALHMPPTSTLLRPAKQGKMMGAGSAGEGGRKKPTNAGGKWFGLAGQELTEEVKRDLLVSVARDAKSLLAPPFFCIC